MEPVQQNRSVWWELSTTGPCMLLRRLIDRHNQGAFDPFYWLAVCYCSPEFDRADIIPPPLHPQRETLNYLVTGLVDPPELEDEHLACPAGKNRWVNVVGGLKQATPSQSVYVLNMELWMHILPGASGGGKRWELESEQVPLVRTDGAQVRILCGRFRECVFWQRGRGRFWQRFFFAYLRRQHYCFFICQRRAFFVVFSQAHFA